MLKELGLDEPQGILRKVIHCVEILRSSVILNHLTYLSIILAWTMGSTLELDGYLAIHLMDCLDITDRKRRSYVKSDVLC